jgi:carbonic anhydrase
MKPEKALRDLMEGNSRFVNEQMDHPHQTAERRDDLRKGQEPFAVVLTCSDSRTAPEIIFDQGLGDLFVIRTAGNIADDVAIGSMELAVSEFGVPMVMVLGHQNCGAIKLALEGSETEGHIADIMKQIRTAIEIAGELPGNPQDNAARANVLSVVNHLKHSSTILQSHINQGKVQIIGAYYWFDDGRVEILES